MADFASILPGQDLNEGGIRLSPAYDHVLRFARADLRFRADSLPGAGQLRVLLDTRKMGRETLKKLKGTVQVLFKLRL